MKTKKWAKELSLEVWEYLRDHPKIKSKYNLPKYLWLNICDLESLCPLCEILYCVECPLQSCWDTSLYAKWNKAKTNETRAKYAGLIVDKIKAWNI